MLPAALRTIVKTKYPAVIHYARMMRYGRRYRTVMFERAYREGWWGSAESVSGPGSTLAETAELRQALPALLRELGVRSILDAPCGDFGWMRTVDFAGISYVGIDIVPALIERLQAQDAGPERRFLVTDLVTDELPQCELVLCRDCLIHLSLADAQRALGNIVRSGAKYALITTENVEVNRDINTGGHRPVNMERAPFNLPAPQRRLRDTQQEFLGLWPVTDLAAALR
jgi:hypothetical protein